MVRTIKPVEERHQEILSAARQLFIANGYKNTSVADIAKQLGIAQGLVFHYFKSKAALLYEVFDQIAAEEQEIARAMLEQHPGKVIDCLELMLNPVHQHHDYERLVVDLREDPAVSEYLEDKMTALVIPLAQELIERGNADGSWVCEYPAETAVFIIQGVAGMIKHSEHRDINRLSEATRSILHKSLGIRPA